MFRLLEIATVLAVSVAMSLALAHTLEWPGKRHLDRKTYLEVQTIYYPGFTFGGLSEFIGVALVLLLLWLSPGESGFTSKLIALGCLIAMQMVFWTITQPVNKYWLANTKLSKAGVAFFRTNEVKMMPSPADDSALWVGLRRRWEYSHIVRAGFALCALIALLLAVVD